MQIEPVDATDARAVLRGLRGAVLGAGPAIALGGAGVKPGAGPGPGAGAGPDSSLDPGANAGGGPGSRAPVPGDAPAGTAVVVTTSGSTGYPKSVVLSRSALTSSALATADRIGSGAWLLALPPGYIAGVQVLVRSLIAGREPAILAGSFSAHAFAAAVTMFAAPGPTEEVQANICLRCITCRMLMHYEFL